MSPNCAAKDLGFLSALGAPNHRAYETHGEPHRGPADHVFYRGEPPPPLQFAGLPAVLSPLQRADLPAMLSDQVIDIELPLRDLDDQAPVLRFRFSELVAIERN